MKKYTRFTMISLVFVLATLFFWSAINNNLVPSKAFQSVNARVFLLDRKIECNVNGVCLAHLYASTNVGVTLAGIQGELTSSSNVEAIAAIHSAECARDSFGLDRTLRFRTTVQQPGLDHLTEFGLGAIKQDNQLRDGNHCVTSIVLKPKNVSQTPDQGTVALADSTKWTAGGPIPVVVQSDTSTVTIDINDSAPIPNITPVQSGPIPTTTVAPTGNSSPTGSVTPTGGATPTGNTTPTITGAPVTRTPLPSRRPTGSCSRKPQADCTCDDAVDVSDWEELRASLNREGPSCDANADGASNALDLSLWITHNDYIK